MARFVVALMVEPNNENVLDKLLRLALTLCLSLWIYKFWIATFSFNSMDDIQSQKTEDKSISQDNIIQTEDDTSTQINQEDFPDSFEGFGYRFNEFGQLRHIITGEPFEFNLKKDDHLYNQKRYEALGEIVTNHVYHLLETECNLIKMSLPLDAVTEEPSTFIYHSEDAFKNEKIVILIHGSGVVRAGQWSRRLIINDSLNSGTQIPFIKRAMGLGYGVFVLNTNDNRRFINGVFIKIRDSESAECHANNVWRDVIIPQVAAKHVAIIAHSYGGIVTVNLCRSFPDSFQERVFAIAFTDSPHSMINQGLSQPSIEWFRKVCRNWVFSHLPLDTYLQTFDDYEVDCYSAVQNGMPVNTRRSKPIYGKTAGVYNSMIQWSAGQWVGMLLRTFSSQSRPLGYPLDREVSSAPVIEFLWRPSI
ncbi:cotranscriptional regulator FAM172A [Trichonephila inaurata madagascariensis]|uniref:Cotranscriptional regulator FAM172A n=1 Tax=Trichonephila inaurata madagascariensis TaxID=2747483 RepID=A0A8X6X6L3_9ARAC|nr:cotranscriptional regulator FAM172A [Trichonephila inaurata madagascariensis]